MTTSPPNHISLSKRDSYGFGADLAPASTEENEDEDQEPIQAFAQEDPQANDIVIPTDFTYGPNGERILESSSKGLIPDSSYGSHLRLTDVEEGQPRRIGDRDEVLNGNKSFPPDRPNERIPRTAGLDSTNASEVNSGAGTPSNTGVGNHIHRTDVDDEFGDFIQGAQVRTTFIWTSPVHSLRSIFINIAAAIPWLIREIRILHSRYLDSS